MKLLILGICSAMTVTPLLGSSVNRNSRHANTIVSMQNSRNPDAVSREIKSLVDADLSSGSSSFSRPAFTVAMLKNGTPQLTIKAGEVGDLGFGDDPYKTPFKQQMLIEAVRRALTDAHLERLTKNTGASIPEAATASGANVGQQWQCFLDQAEQLVRQSVAAIQTVTNKNELKDLLQQIDDQIDDLLYNKLFESIQAYASQNKVNVIFDRGGDAPKPFSVIINTAPNGARIWVLKGLRYQQLLRLGNAAPAQWPWEEVVQNPAQLIGKYRYKARWPDGQFTEGDIDVKSSSPVTLRQ